MWWKLNRYSSTGITAVFCEMNSCLACTTEMTQDYFVCVCQRTLHELVVYFIDNSYVYIQIGKFFLCFQHYYYYYYYYYCIYCC
jgi:hypothetical protein